MPPPPCCSQVHAINERILDFGEALRRALPEGEAADIGRTSVAEVTQVSRDPSMRAGEGDCSSHVGGKGHTGETRAIHAGL